jgi:predicted transposase/invertase (TIGR01784 family)
MYDSSLKYKWDNKNVVDYARQEGMEQGMLKGIEKGIEKGKLDKAITITKEMKNDGMPLAQISKFTKLSIEEIQKL